MSNVTMTSPNIDTGLTRKLLQPADLAQLPAIPVEFAGCTGTMHPAAGETGVIILAPFGHEAMASHKTLQLLADNLAASGMPVLRFDYPGTGDAPGDEMNRELIASRCRAVVDACRFFREQGNVRRIAFVGLRLGATIAALQAETCNVQNLVMIEPVVSGQDWLHQLENLQAIPGVRNFRSSGKLKGGGAKFLGYGMSMASLEAVRTVHLSTASLQKTCRVLMLFSDRSLDAGRLSRQWIKEGLDVDARPYAALSQLIGDPTVVKSATDSLEGVASWLRPEDVKAKPVTFKPAAPFISGTDYKEQPVFFGGSMSRFGVLCEPMGLRKPGPAVILLNTGGENGGAKVLHGSGGIMLLRAA
jgi:pimeloyl-ACP methyl ester carboxylesterase